jgi:hypothetical protein
VPVKFGSLEDVLVSLEFELCEGSHGSSGDEGEPGGTLLAGF